MIASTMRALYPRLRRPFILPPAPAADFRPLQGGEIVRSLVATIFGRATFVLPSCDGPFTGIVSALAVMTQTALPLSLIGLFSPGNSLDWKMGQVRGCHVRPSRTNPP